jgi:hypothetical protein
MRFTLSSLIAAALVVALPWAAAAQAIQLRVVSNPRPEFVSGGDVLVSVQFPAGVQAPNVRLTLNGSDVTSSLRPVRVERTLMALVTGLADGANTLVASAGSANAKLTVPGATSSTRPTRSRAASRAARWRPT